MADFFKSTHSEDWVMSPSDLFDRRLACLERAKARSRARGVTIRVVAPPPFTKKGPAKNNGEDGGDENKRLGVSPTISAVPMSAKSEAAAQICRTPPFPSADTASAALMSRGSVPPVSPMMLATPHMSKDALLQGTPMSVARTASASSRHVLGTMMSNDLNTVQEVASDFTLSLAECMQLEQYYLRNLRKTCLDMRYPRRVMLTALVYFRRCFLSECIFSSEEPEAIALTAIYLAGKTEEMKPGPGYPPSHRGIDVEKFSAYCKLKKKSKIYAGEMGLLRTLSFQLLVFHPMRALRGWIESYKQRARKADEKLASDESFKELQDLAEDRIVWAYFTDALFTATPGGVGAACLLLAIKSMGDSSPLSVEKFQACWGYFYEKYAPEPEREKLSLEGLEALAQVIQSGDVSIKVDLMRSHEVKSRRKKLKAALEARKRKVGEMRHASSRDSDNAKDAALASSSPENLFLIRKRQKMEDLQDL